MNLEIISFSKPNKKLVMTGKKHVTPCTALDFEIPIWNLKDRNVESDLNSLVKMSAGLRLPEM
jgi:hypothetical protein